MGFVSWVSGFAVLGCRRQPSTLSPLSYIYITSEKKTPFFFPFFWGGVRGRRFKFLQNFLEIFPVFFSGLVARPPAARRCLPCPAARAAISADFFENVLVNLPVFLRCSTQFRHFLEAEAACGLGLAACLAWLASRGPNFFCTGWPGQPGQHELP